MILLLGRVFRKYLGMPRGGSVGINSSRVVLGAVARRMCVQAERLNSVVTESG